MIDTGLKDRILLRPAREGATTLCIVSGYAEPSMAWTHWERDLSGQIQVCLLVGMSLDARPENLSAFFEYKLRDYQMLSAYSESPGFTGSFACRFVTRGPAIHSKLYVWLGEDNLPVSAYIGSPNYTYSAFAEAKRGEIAAGDSDLDGCYGYFRRHWEAGMDCNDPSLPQILRARARSLSFPGRRN